MMSLYSPIAIKSMFQKYNIKPKKYLGQNFVINQSVINNIIKAANLSANDTVVEIGPGLGALTIKLAEKTKQVIAVEKDKMICEILQRTLQEENIKNVTIINADILDLKNWKLKIARPQRLRRSEVGQGNWKLVANIPYYITQPIIRLFLESETPPQSITLLVQKEVAQRICAVAPKMNLLAISVQFYAQPEIISYVSKNNFWPRPKVDSAIITIKPRHHAPETSPPRPGRYNVRDVETDVITSGTWKPRKKETENFFKTVRAGFSSPRKMLIGNLNKKLGIPREIILKIYQNLGINSKIRAENLTIKDWGELSTTIFSHLAKNMV